jgi:TetR/AcrR family transcriptional repressor of bet genes
VVDESQANNCRGVKRNAFSPLPETAAEGIEFAAGFLPIDAESRREWRVWIAFWGRAINDAGLRERHRAYYQEIISRLAAQLRRPNDAGRATTLRDARQLADAIVAAIDGVGTRAALEADDWPPRRQRETLARLLGPLLASLSSAVI